MRDKAILKNIYDLYPITVIMLGVGISVLLVFTEFSFELTWILFSLALVFRHLIPLHQHHHAHESVFRNKSLNFIYDTLLALGGGNTTPVWVLHHNIGHHGNYLDPEEDIEGHARFGKDLPLKRMVFTLLGTMRTVYDSYQVLTKVKNKNLRKDFYLHLLVQNSLYLVFLAIDPMKALLFLILPNIYLKLLVFWFNYGQHEGLEGTDAYDSSITDYRYGPLFLNLGHHSAHHEKPGLHWSKLSQRTREIEALIPEDCLRGQKLANLSLTKDFTPQ